MSSSLNSTELNENSTQQEDPFFQTQIEETNDHFTQTVDISQELFNTQDDDDDFLSHFQKFSDDSNQSSPEKMEVDEQANRRTFCGEVAQYFANSPKTFKSSARRQVSLGKLFFANSINDENFSLEKVSANIIRPTKRYPLSIQQQSSISTLSQSVKFTQNDEIYDIIPPSILKIYNEVKEQYSDWTFIYILVGQLCSDKFPFGSYHNLKLSLLMSLVTPTRESSPMHILAIGSEQSDANFIMREIGEFAERFLITTNKTAEVISLSKNQACEGGSLVMSSCGVAFVGYWQLLKPKVKIQLLREIETNSLMVQKAQKTFPLESIVWAHWNYSKKIKNDMAAIDQFLSVFGIPIIFNDSSYEKDISFDLINQLSVNPPKKNEYFKIPDDEMKKFVCKIRDRRVKFDQQSEKMLKEYYSATKTIRKGEFVDF